MYNSMFGAGSGDTAFGFDMMVLEEIEKEEARKEEMRERYMDFTPDTPIFSPLDEPETWDWEDDD